MCENENVSKCSPSSSPAPVLRAGCGDLSEREYSREQRSLQTVRGESTQVQKLRSPVSKFTAQCTTPNKQLSQVKKCLDTFHTPKCTPRRIPVKAALKKIGQKAISMEDLTPTKRVKIERCAKMETPNGDEKEARQLRVAEKQQSAALVISRFMMLSSLRRRRDEVKCLKKTLESQVSCSERLRIQVSTLKSLLESDNRKVVLALREMERMKTLLRDKEQERSVLDKENQALQEDIIAEQNRASEIQTGWQNCRNELETTRGMLTSVEHTLTQERAAGCSARAQREDALHRLVLTEQSLEQHVSMLSKAEQLVGILQEEASAKERLLEVTIDQLEKEVGKRKRAESEAAALSARVSNNALETNILKMKVTELQSDLERLTDELRVTRDQLDWWPRPLTKLMGAARSWLRNPISLHEAILWTMLPARHGC